MTLVRGLRAWLLTRDPRWRAARRAARTAIVMPALFALGLHVIGNATVATFAAFGSFALLLLADFGGPLSERVAAQLALVAAGCVFICLGTLASRNAWAAALSMLVVGFLVLFAGVVSSVLAGASTSVLLSFILPVSTVGAPAAIPDRLAGWLLAGAASVPAATLLWPAPVRDPLRDAAAAACRELSTRLTAEGARHDGDDMRIKEAVARSDTAVARLRDTFLTTSYRPAGLTTAARAVVRLVDEVIWLHLILEDAGGSRPSGPLVPTVRAVKAAAAVLLEHAGRALDRREPPQDSLRDHLDDLAAAGRAMEAAAADAVTWPPPVEAGTELVASLTPSFRAQELTFAIMAIAENVETVTVAEQRRWCEKLLGRRPGGLAGPVASAQRRALAHVEPHSVWLHNSVRGAIALAGAVLVAHLTEAPQAFWIVLGALSVLRSNALSTGESVLRGVVGTTVGFVVGGLVVVALGTNTTLLWVLLPVAILLAGVAPALSFTGGQAGFTVALLILFNIISTAGWRVGLVRIEDVAIGCAVSLLVGAMFWPRGATAAFRRELAEAYVDGAAYLRAAVESGAGPDAGAVAEQAATRAVASARRLDDAFRQFLAERGVKHLTLSEVTALLTGVTGLRLTAHAVRDLWLGDAPRSPRRGTVEAPRARLELIATTERVTNWCVALAQAVAGVGTVPRVLPHDDEADRRLVTALRRDIGEEAAGNACVRSDVVRIIWTSHHVDAARRLQDSVEQPARAAAAYRGRNRR